MLSAGKIYGKSGDAKCTHKDEQNAALPCVVRALGPEKKNEPSIRRSQYAQVLHSEKVTIKQAITAP